MLLLLQLCDALLQGGALCRSLGHHFFHLRKRKSGVTKQV